MKELTFVVVDDAVFMRTLLKKIIEEVETYKVVAEGANGFEAIQKAQLFKPDIMTLDITMPDMDGLTAVKEILKCSPDTKIIMVSAMASSRW